MYKKLKSFLFKFIPRSFFVQNETFFRKCMALFYIGSKHQCPICEKKNRSFILNQRGEQLCPNCGSLPRDRCLYLDISKEIQQKPNMHLLDFSPSRSVYRKLHNLDNLVYFPSDLSTNFIAEYQFDITNMPVENNFFDAIICFHILEHVEQDVQAMKELYRVLKKNGFAYLQTPFKDGEIYENMAIKTPEERLKHFGQEDHVRIYSVAGLQSRLEAVGFQVAVQIFQADNYHGISSNETILRITK